MTAKCKAPWPDFVGAPIYEGDVMRHPDGAEGLVVIDLTVKNVWRVVYPDEISVALSLQVGDKGRAVVVQPKPSTPRQPLWEGPWDLQIDSYMTGRQGVVSHVAAGVIQLEYTDGSSRWKLQLPVPKP